MADLTIFGRPGCMGCKATIRKAQLLGLSFEYVDLDHDIAAAAQLLADGYRSLPVVQAGDQVWTGFRPDLINQVEAGRAKR